MLTIRGTRHADYLYAPDSGARILGRLGNDTIEGRAGNDILRGDAGDDYLFDSGGGYNLMYGGRGDDRIEAGAGEAWGGVGNDDVWAIGLAVGGKGDDVVYGAGQLFGDEGPGLEQRTAGNDKLYTDTTGAHTQMTGGLGADEFHVGGAGAQGVVEIMDFQAGEDKVAATDTRFSADLFAALDANHNGVLEWSDSIGADGDWSTPDGGAVYTDGHNLYLGLGATFATATSNDATDLLVVHGVTQISAADWLMA